MGIKQDRKVKLKKYGPRFKEFNKWFKENKRLLLCEISGEPAHVVHHIVRAGQKYSDEPHFWIILGKTAHWYAGRCLQDFELDRLIEWEEKWLKRWSAYRWTKSRRRSR